MGKLDVAQCFAALLPLSLSNVFGHYSVVLETSVPALFSELERMYQSWEVMTKSWAL